MVMHGIVSDDGKNGLGKGIVCLIVIGLVCLILATGCSSSAAGGIRSEWYYPDDWKKGGDPAKSRLAGADIDASSTPGRPPVPGGK